MKKDNPSRSYYTYLLSDPADGHVFYVGKGQGARMDAHVREAKQGNSGCNPRKYQKIREILERGENVTVQIFSRHQDEDEAFDAEDLLIAALTGPDLANIAGSRSLARKEWAELLLGRIKPFETWVATCGQDNIDFATRYSGSPRVHYDNLIAAVKQEGNRLGGNTVYCRIPASVARLEQGPFVKYAHR